MADDEGAVERLRERQDGGYRPPVVTEPDGGPIPQWQPPTGDDDDAADD
jgi:hypothetical protein